MNWPAIQAARRHDAAARVPFLVGTALAGSVARQHLAALGDWPQWLQVDAAGVHLLVDRPDAALQLINTRLRHQGLIPAWRDEAFAVPALAGTGCILARMERAAARFWGTLTFGAHANGFVTDTSGRPTHLWIARRAWDKPTDPGLMDNLIGGGVPAGQTPLQTLHREAWEEAGLQSADLGALRAGRVIHLLRDIPEGLQREALYSFDLPLPADRVPHNQDGEVAGFTLLPVADALAFAAGEGMTVDAALVTLDFALRHGLTEAPAGTDALFSTS
jgi:8-oxo-dGTP pyrophosphatase MutT (NUDIX family)